MFGSTVPTRHTSLLSLHKSIKTHKCEICDKTFSWKCTLMRHIAVHNNVKTNRCELCEKVFTEQYSLKLHVKRVHNHIKEHNYNLCSMQFVTISELIHHMRVHTGKSHTNVVNALHHLHNYNNYIDT